MRSDAMRPSIHLSISLLYVTIPSYDRFPSSEDVEDEYVGEDDKGGDDDDDDDDDEVQILPSRGKKGSSSTNCRSTPKPIEKKKPSSSRTLNIATTTSSSVGKGRGRDAPPQRDDIEDDEGWDRPMKKEVRQVRSGRQNESYVSQFHVIQVNRAINLSSVKLKIE